LREATQQTFCTSCNIEVIYNFIDAEYYHRQPNENLRREIAPNGEKIILHISTFRPVKRIMDCIEVVARMHDRENGSDSQFAVKLVMCGDGPERQEAEKLASDRGISDAVLFAGKQPQAVIRDYLSIADLLLLTSQSESFGLVALEAMACEVPVVATRVGGVPEVVEEGETGFLFPVGDVEAMADAAILILNDPQTARRMGKRGRELAIERFTDDKIIPQYEALYASLLNKK
jgi:N-acetyl-alpha-D-glucosaminyl L-malate synthase BshA